MKTIIGFLTVLVLALSTIWVIRIAEGRCTWCPTYNCYGSCPDGCVCISPPGQGWGKCYGINNREEFEARGYRVLP